MVLDLVVPVKGRPLLSSRAAESSKWITTASAVANTDLSSSHDTTQAEIGLDSKGSYPPPHSRHAAQQTPSSTN